MAQMMEPGTNKMMKVELDGHFTDAQSYQCGGCIKTKAKIEEVGNQPSQSDPFQVDVECDCVEEAE